MAHWDYLISGGYTAVQVLTGGDVPNIPGSVSKDYTKLGIPLPFHLKDIVRKFWGKSGNYNYVSLPKLTNAGKYQFGYWWGGRYNRNYGSILHTFEFSVPSSNKFYFGGNVFYNGLASHRGNGGYQSNPLIMKALVTYVDGTTEVFQVNTRWYHVTHDIGSWNVVERIGKVISTQKYFNHIKVTAQFYNGGAQWHDIGDHGAPWNDPYRNQAIKMKSGVLLNAMFDNDLTSWFNLPYWNGGVDSNNKVTEVRDNLPRNLQEINTLNHKEVMSDGTAS